MTVEQIYAGGEIDLELALPEVGDDGLPHRVSRTFRVRIPKGAEDGQRLRLAGKGGAVAERRARRRPLRRARAAAASAAIASTAATCTSTCRSRLGKPCSARASKCRPRAATVELNVPAGTAAGRRLRLAKRGLPAAQGPNGDLYAVVRIEVPTSPGAKERALYEQLKAASSFDARARSTGGGG